MLTTRGFWFLLVVLLLLLLGLLIQQETLILLPLTLLLWFIGQWLLFAVRAYLVPRSLVLERSVCDERGPTETLWAGRPFEVRVRLRLEGRGHPAPTLGLPYVGVADWVPFGVEVVGGEPRGDGALNREQPLELTYRGRSPAVGTVRFEGLRVQFADFQGFFAQSVFVGRLVTCRVLPVLADERGRAATSKRHNLLPPPGIHRLRRPGSGSELLDLRDYLPGDPPKTIAWKVSARRDRLITKEFESEVPLRCTLFVDTSNSVRLGPLGENALARLLHISAAVAQANAAARDLTGLCLFDEHGATHLRPARTARHLAELLNRLADAANLSPSTGAARVEDLLPLAHAFAQEVYPHLLRPEVNAVPFWLPWLWVLPSERTRTPTTSGRLFRWLFWGVSLVPVALFLLVVWGVLAYAEDALHQLGDAWDPVTLLLVPFALLLGLIVFYADLLALVRAFFSRLFNGRERRLARWRKQLAAVISVQQRLGPGGLARLLEDDEQLSLRLQQFLAEHRVPYPLPLYDAAGRYLFAAQGKVEVLAHALLAAVGKGHDNELFVLLVDLLELDDLTPLLRAVRVALARHHQVIVVCPWPPGVPPAGPVPERVAERAAQRTGPVGVLNLLHQITTRRYHAAFHRVRGALGRLGVPVACAATDEPVPLILDRLERLRMLGRRR